MTHQGDDDIGRLSLQGACTLRTADEIHGRLLEMSRQHAALEVDCSEVEEVDLSFVQLLLSARVSLASAKRTFRLSRPASGPLLDALRRGGFISGRNMTDDAFWLQPESV